MSTVLGVDPSLSCTGLAIVVGGLLTDSGVIRTASTSARAVRLAAIYDGVTEWLRRLPDLDVSVAIEDYARDAKFQRETMGEVGGVIRLAIYRFGLDYMDIAPASWQLQLLDAGRVEKSLRGVQLIQRHGSALERTNFETFDAVEAFAIALAGWQRVEGKYTPPARRAKARKGTTELANLGVSL